MSAGGTTAEPAGQWLEAVTVEPRRWREACASELDGGGRFGGAYASGSGPRAHWRAIFAHPAGARVLSTTVGEAGAAGREAGAAGREAGAAGREAGAETIVDLIPAAGWDEREARDLYGLEFAGHEPIRPLVEHPADPGRWTVPSRGRGVHEVAVGPIHAGVIESGHFRFHVVGERILHLDARLFHKHRGLERAAEGREADAGLAYAQRACGACAVANSVAYAQACESALGLRAPLELRRSRTAALELERLYNHLNDVVAICAGFGFAAGNMAFAALKERAMRINMELSGHRFLFGAVALGRGGLTVDAAAADRARGALRELGADSARTWRELAFAGSVQARLGEVGILGAEDAAALGTVGPAARACGLALDARTESPALAYPAGFRPAVAADATGDVGARLRVRGAELEVTLALLAELLAAPLVPVEALPAGAGAPLGVARVESPRGETVCAVELEGRRLARLRLRSGSYANWPALAHAAAGNLLPDFPLINKSFELCYACADR